MSSIESFTTARISARKVSIGDQADLFRMNQDPLVMQTLGGIRSLETTMKSLNDNMRHWDAHGFGMWILRDRRSDEFIGRGMLKRTRVHAKEEVEVGYALLSPYWRQGLGYELVRKLADIAFATLGIETLVAHILPTNAGSRRIIEKLGGHFEEELVHAGLPHALYRIRRAVRWQ